ncbi:hypothetical protein V054_01822 [Staphylococcus aureus MSSA-47]|nr:hypothetical protein V054_01822 [Staphylococcus aureus MSSA-47]EZT47781.1 hypothetical protein V053_01719 [Staphylococcus aureus MSSA-37]EZT50393.1 hypothetical protein V056_02013 [Staphylococcus aureus MSSA-123]EZY39567.1 hypothetical protein V055_02082 [Staphylococcus aureus MRSA-118]EZY44012.1 hypothetical protein V057_01891 [Staphylococcus aureus MRSA-136]OWT05263.1 hypothetical protein AS567_12845 [Staphylococcus aureus]
MKRLSTTLKVRLISNFLQLIITTAFIPFIALYLTDMLSQSIVGIYLVGLVVLKFPLSIISGYLIEIFPKKLLVLIYQATMVIMLVFMGVFGSHQLWQIIGFCVAYAIFTIVWGLQFPVWIHITPVMPMFTGVRVPDESLNYILSKILIVFLSSSLNFSSNK